MSAVHTNQSSTSAQRRRSQRVTDAVVAEYLNTISRRPHNADAPALRSAAPYDEARIRTSELRRPILRRPSA